MAHLVRQQPRHFTLLTVAHQLLVTGPPDLDSSEGARVRPRAATRTRPARRRHEPRPEHRRDDDRRRRGDGRHRQRRDGERPDLQRHDPGPEFRLKVGDTVIVHFENNLAHATGHPLARHRAAQRERRHAADAEPGAAGRHVPLQVHGDAAGDLLVSPAPSLLDQPGVQGALRIDHRHRSERGRARQATATLPSAAQTQTLALSDITVCKAPGTQRRGDLRPRRCRTSSGGALPAQRRPDAGRRSARRRRSTRTATAARRRSRPATCRTSSKPARRARSNEGQTVLTNGMNVGGRAGTPAAPGALAPGAQTLDVPGRPGTAPADRQRGDDPVLPPAPHRQRGHADPARPGRRPGRPARQRASSRAASSAGFDFKYDAGEILLDPGDRADVVAAIPGRRRPAC